MNDDVNAALERLSDRSMPGLERHRVGDWLLRSALRATGRANCVWVRDDPGCEVSSAIDSVEAWYRQRDATVIFQLFDGTDVDVSTELDARGYRTATGAVVMTAGIGDVRLDASSDGSATTSSSPDQAFASLVGDEDRLAETVMTPLDQHFVTLDDRDGTLLGGGLAVLDDQWLGIFAMNTLPEARRRGVARRVLRELIEWGRGSGATSVWLQVMPTNAPARSLYREVGFVDSHQYHYRSGPNWRD